MFEFDKPQIQNPDDVLIKIALAGLCRTDVYVAEGIVKAKDPIVLGHEFSGIVEALGKDVSNIKVGERVAVMPILPSNDYFPNHPYSISTMIGIEHDGAFGEYIIVPAHAVYRLPDNVPLIAGAYMEPIAASLAVLNADITPQQKGLIYGDNRISRLTERIMNAKGFNNVDVYDHSNVDSEPLAANSYDYIIETLATTKTMKHIIRAVKPGGRIVLKSRQHTPVAFDISELVKKDITLQAVNYGSFAESIELVAGGKLKVDDLFGDVYPIENYKEVFTISKTRETKKLFFTAVDKDVWDK